MLLDEIERTADTQDHQDLITTRSKRDSQSASQRRSAEAQKESRCGSDTCCVTICSIATLVIIVSAIALLVTDSNSDISMDFQAKIVINGINRTDMDQQYQFASCDELYSMLDENDDGNSWEQLYVEQSHTKADQMSNLLTCLATSDKIDPDKGLD